MNPVYRVVRNVWEIPLSVASLAFYKTTRALIRRKLKKQQAQLPQTPTWRPLSTKLLQLPGVLPWLMTTGPRWNTHAIIATSSPFEVKHSLALDVAAAKKSAGAWTLAIYTFPGAKTVAHIGSIQRPFAEDWATVTLSPGRYSLGLRYYHWADRVELPAVKADDQPMLAAMPLPGTINHFYADLAQSTTRFYRALHYYVFTLLRFRRWLPESFVVREFLPVGNPETHFQYGALEAGDVLQIALSEPVRAAYDVYLTLYNRASFPVHSAELAADHYLTPAGLPAGFYLLRINPKQPGAAPAFASGITITRQGAA
jgi:hypothetical protein